VSRTDQDGPPLSSVRLDIWLDVACLFKTRSEAQSACKLGKIDVNGQTAKPNRLLRVNDQIVIKRPFGRQQRVLVRGLAEKHVSKADARQLYDDQTPAPSPDEIERRRLERMFRAAVTPIRAPDKRERRALRRLKEQDEMKGQDEIDD
jgi:ribosome-associated heat shock protein Hsp15